MLKMVEQIRPGGKQVYREWDREQSGMVLGSDFSDQVDGDSGETIRRQDSFEEKDRGHLTLDMSS